MGNQDSKYGSAVPIDGRLHAKGIKKMDKKLQEKLYHRKAMTFNMKILIRGATNTGKSTLFTLLKGGSFVDTYHTTPEIQTAHINWNYKMTNEIVLVELWDVVDKGKSRIIDESELVPHPIGHEKQLSLPSISPSKSQPNEEEKKKKKQFNLPPCDAQMVDVYQGCHAVIIIIDPRQKSSFDYAIHCLRTIPEEINVLIMVNCRDVPQKHRWLSESDMEQFMRTQPERVKYIECSLKNTYGIPQFYDFLNIPFLTMKLEYFRNQIAQCEAELKKSEEDMECVLEQQDYEQFLATENTPSEALTKINDRNSENYKKDVTIFSNNIQQQKNHQDAKIQITQSGKGIEKDTISQKRMQYKQTKDSISKGKLKNDVNPSILREEEETLENFHPGELEKGFFEESDSSFQVIQQSIESKTIDDTDIQSQKKKKNPPYLKDLVKRADQDPILEKEKKTG